MPEDLIIPLFTVRYVVPSYHIVSAVRGATAWSACHHEQRQGKRETARQQPARRPAVVCEFNARTRRPHSSHKGEGQDEIALQSLGGGASCRWPHAGFRRSRPGAV